MSEKYSLDEFDIKLLQLLQENARTKNTDLAKTLNVTEGAIRKRIAKLIHNNYIEKFTIQVSEKLYGIRAVVDIQIEGTVAPTIIRERMETEIIKGIEAIYETAGDIDLIVIFHTGSDEELKDAIETVRAIPGVKGTRTHVVLKRTIFPPKII